MWFTGMTMLTEASQSRSDDCAATLPLCTPPSQTSERLSDCAHRFDASDVRLSGTLLQTGLSVFSFTVWSFLPRSTNRSPFHAFRLPLVSSPHSCFTARACLWIPSASLTRYISRPGCLELTDVCSGDVWKNVLSKKAELNCDAIQCNFAPVGFEVMMEVGRDALVSMSWMTKVKMLHGDCLHTVIHIDLNKKYRQHCLKKTLATCDELDIAIGNHHAHGSWIGR